MPWDVFISHASDDKTEVAEPLAAALEAAGVSVWLDKKQITLGDSLMQSISDGLAHCRYGVVILSPSFFRKHWTQKELAALFARETTDGKKVILPVVHGMTIDEVRRLAPLLADVMMAFWDDGVSSVVAKIIEVVTGGQRPEVSVSADTGELRFRKEDLQSLVLLLCEDGRAFFFRSEDITASEEEVEMLLEAQEASDTAILSELAAKRTPILGVAYGNSAISVKIKELKQKRAAGKEKWVVRLKVDQESQGCWGEMTFNNLSPDRLAEMRARRILLNEQLPRHEGSSLDAINAGMIESFVAGQTGMKIAESPFLHVYAALGSKKELFEAVARLYALLCLRLSGTVEQVLKLDLRLLKNHRLRVSFSGKRPRRFSNVEPPVISVEGECDLSGTVTKKA